MKFRVDNEDNGNRDIFGGLITEENAFFTTLSHIIDDKQPRLKDMEVGDKQRRYGHTADSTRPRPAHGARKAGAEKEQRRIIYAVWRVE